MQEQSPYRPPEATLVDREDATELAGRWIRLGAAFIDGLVMLAIMTPVMFAGGYFQAAMEAGSRGEQLPLSMLLLWAVIGFVIFVAVQGYPLAQWGQTWGKKLLAIKIVDLEGRKPPLGKLLALRYLPVQVVVNVPMIGPLAALVNVLFIFREDQRCVHDLIAGTRVVVAR